MFFKVALRVGLITKTMLTPLLPWLLLLLPPHDPRPYTQISTASGATPTAALLVPAGEDGDTAIEVIHAAVVGAVLGSVK